MLDASHIAGLHDLATLFWHDPSAPAPRPASPLDDLVLSQHHANFDLWHREDAARDPLAADHDIAEVKHDIDKLNQRRNDLMERLDSALLEDARREAVDVSHSDIPLHSESPGLMIDRLSILALKIFHTAEEVHRFDASEEHHMRNRERLAVLAEQRADLAQCLDELWTEVLAGRRRFKIYRQLKMYNDPSLNPVLYGKVAT
jgi:hypothetical protein